MPLLHKLPILDLSIHIAIDVRFLFGLGELLPNVAEKLNDLRIRQRGELSDEIFSFVFHEEEKRCARFGNFLLGFLDGTGVMDKYGRVCTFLGSFLRNHDVWIDCFL
jgi:hypothetical protein